jgi:outer membrane protein TolC
MLARAAVLLFAWAPTLAAQQAAPQAASGADAQEQAPRPTVNDAMLTPPTPPRRVIQSWDDAFKLLGSRSTDLRISYDEVRKAEAQSRVALAQVLPTLSAEGTASHTLYSSSDSNTSGLGSPGRNSLEGRLTLSMPLVDARAWHAIGTAHVSEQAARLSHDDLQRTTAANVASTIVSTVTAERVAELNRVGLRNALERLQLTVAKEATGTATGLDIVRAKQDVAQARGSVVGGDEALRQSREALGLALGLSEPVGVAPSIDLKSLQQSALHSCRAIGDQEQRSDIIAARKRLEVAKRNVTEVDLQYLPTLSAQSTLSSTATDATTATGATSPPRTTWNISATLSIPIWDGGARYGQRRSAAAEEDQTAQELESLRRGVTIELLQARRAVEVAEQSRTVALESRDLAADVDRLTLSGYRTGKGTSLDVVVAASALRQAEINLALQEFSVVRSRIAELLALATCAR